MKSKSIKKCYGFAHLCSFMKCSVALTTAAPWRLATAEPHRGVVAASRSEGLWAGTVRAVHTARFGRSHEKKKGKIFHEISSMWCKQI